MNYKIRKKLTKFSHSNLVICKMIRAISQKAKRILVITMKMTTGTWVIKTFSFRITIPKQRKAMKKNQRRKPIQNLLTRRKMISSEDIWTIVMRKWT